MYNRSVLVIMKKFQYAIKINNFRRNTWNIFDNLDLYQKDL